MTLTGILLKVTNRHKSGTEMYQGKNIRIEELSHVRVDINLPLKVYP